MAIFHSSAMLLAIILFLRVFQMSCEFFDSNGRLTQVEYANKASMSGGTVIGIRSDDVAILITWSSWTDKNVILPRKIHRITDFTGVSSSGIVSDVNYITDKMFEEATEHSFIFGSDPPASRLAMSIADYVHERTISARYRPLGIRTCIASYDEISKASIIEIDVIGNLHKCKLTCVGPYSQKFLSNWKEILDNDNSEPSEMIRNCLNNLKKCVEEDDLLIFPDEVNVAFVGKNKPFSTLHNELISEAISNDDYSMIRNFFNPSLSLSLSSMI